MEDILPSMASNRKVQRLLNEFMDLLSEYEIADTNQEQRKPVLAKTTLPKADQIESCRLTTDKDNNAQAKSDEKPQQEYAAIDCKKDSPQEAKDPMDSGPSLGNEENADACGADEVVPDSQPMEDGS
ncbi:hypothetical protein PIB30_088332 [Stylosanthes scabra]|uniref:Uncharacterized protein n=1 Tax=Stylosanthes scabra TaxID=79078 RepID=A0ABU6USI2_9FABA|nr:hypothetical protein [Stylosanthes scabra]